MFTKKFSVLLLQIDKYLSSYLNAAKQEHEIITRFLFALIRFNNFCCLIRYLRLGIDEAKIPLRITENGSILFGFLVLVWLIVSPFVV